MPALDDAHLGALIRKARQDRGAGLREFAQQVSLPHSTLAKIEAGQRAVRGVELVRIAEQLGVSVDEIVAAGDVSVDVARSAARAAAEAASSAVAVWIAAADRVAGLEDSDTGAPPAGLGVMAYLPEVREVGVRADGVDEARWLLKELARRVVVVALPADSTD